MNRRFPLVLIAVLLAAFGFVAPSAHASGVDPQVVAEAISEEGYYIDSGARYLKSDTAQDRLRSELERAKSPVFVAVVPAGTTLSPAQVYRLAKRKGTYAVLTGGNLRAQSNTLSATRVRTAVTQAVQSHRGDPGAAVVAFVGLTNGTKRAAARPRPTLSGSTSAPTSAEPSADTSAAAAQPTDNQSDDGGSSLPLLIVGLVAVICAAGAGYLVYRKGREPKSPNKPAV
jgi:cobalamin biosynthesis Mg chelatase CobN